MDYLGDAIALTIDTLVLGVCLRNYFKKKRAMTMIQGAPMLDIDNNLQDIVSTHPDKKLSYVSLRGSVKPIGNPIVSTNNAKVLGVIQLLSIKEHIVQRSTAGFWSDHERLIQEVHNIMPFVIESKGYKVEIVDPLGADVLDMDVISDVFSPTVPTVMDHIWGFFAGVRQRGVQTTEKMLRKGAIITGIGELITSDDGKGLRLQPPTNGAPFYLTNMQVTSLVKKLDDSRRNYRLLCVIFGTIGIIIGGLMLRRYWKNRCQKQHNEKRRQDLENTRKERRRNVRDGNLTEAQLCVVCKTNPREMILLPCGHVCLCEDCGDDIIDKCPVCRGTIENKLAAYLA